MLRICMIRMCRRLYAQTMEHVCRSQSQYLWTVKLSDLESDTTYTYVIHNSQEDGVVIRLEALQHITGEIDH